MNSGHPYPLGSNCSLEGVNFALFSAHATRVELCVFNEKNQETRYELPAKSGHIWHGFLPHAKAGLRYGYRVSGQWSPSTGAYFNPAKLLLDPYAQAIDGPLPSTGNKLNDNEINQQDNAVIMPKCIVVDHSTYDWQQDCAPKIPWSHTIIYEAHVKGLTQCHPDIPAAIRGSYAALAHPIMLDYLTALGITTLELLPIQLHADEPALMNKGLTNYWGYNVACPFSVEPRYWSGQANSTPLSEFCDMVKALHKAGIEVILDVVFNHTAELDADGPLYSLRGIDNQSYYFLDENHQYLNWSGCGNTLKSDQPVVVRLIMDCLRFWRQMCHVDGFRFDLAATLARQPHFSAHHPLLVAIEQDPILMDCKLIAEPWDIGPNGYQLGLFPYPFAEWNDQYRNDMRRFWLHNNLPQGTFAMRYAGSADVFHHSGRPVSSSINVITSHDGFTLHDLVSFNQKHNLVNGEHNHDGTDDNLSHNHGVEGVNVENVTIDAHCLFRRRTAVKALLSTLLLSLGTPMLLAGDEMGHSQRGNNNAYCQDNALTWINWQEKDEALIHFVQGLTHLRQQLADHQLDDWWQDKQQAQSSYQVNWFTAQGEPLLAEQWQQCQPATLLIELPKHHLIIINGSRQPQIYQLPVGYWQLMEPFSEQECVIHTQYASVAGHCICVLSPLSSPSFTQNKPLYQEEGTP